MSKMSVCVCACACACVCGSYVRDVVDWGRRRLKRTSSEKMERISATKGMPPTSNSVCKEREMVTMLSAWATHKGVGHSHDWSDPLYEMEHAVLNKPQETCTERIMIFYKVK